MNEEPQTRLAKASERIRHLVKTVVSLSTFMQAVIASAVILGGSAVYVLFLLSPDLARALQLMFSTDRHWFYAGGYVGYPEDFDSICDSRTTHPFDRPRFYTGATCVRIKFDERGAILPDQQLLVFNKGDTRGRAGAGADFRVTRAIGYHDCVHVIDSKVTGTARSQKTGEQIPTVWIKAIVGGC